MNLIREDVMVAYADGELAFEECRKLERLLEIDTDSRRVLLSLRLAALYAKEAMDSMHFSGGDCFAYGLTGRDGGGISPHRPLEPSETPHHHFAEARRVKRKIKTP